VSNQEAAERLTEFARRLPGGSRVLVKWSPGQPQTDWLGALGHDPSYELYVLPESGDCPAQPRLVFGTAGSSLQYLMSRVRKHLEQQQ
jgi:hypothetical protein